MNGQRLVTDDELAAMVQMYKSGVGVTQIAEQLGRHHQTVTRQLQAASVRQAASRVPTFTADAMAEALERYQRGDAVDAICAELGVSSGGLYHHLAKHNIPRRGYFTEHNRVDVVSPRCRRCELLLGRDARGGLCEYCLEEGHD
jgi:transposase-like protein